MSARALATNLGLALASLVTCFVAVEVALRVTSDGGPPSLDESFDRPTVFYLSDPERQSPWAAGEEDPLEVIFIGDSFTVGQANQFYDAFPWRIERLLNLNEGQRPARVRVFARKGLSTKRQLPALRRAVDRGADLIVLTIYLNDPEGTRDSESRDWRDRMLPRRPEGFLGALVDHSTLAARAYTTLETRRVVRARRDYYRRLYDPEYPGWKEFRGAVHEFAETCRERNIGFLAVIYPGMGNLGEEYPYDYAHEAIHSVLQEAGVEHRLDLLDTFRDLDPYRMSAYPRIDAHPSEISHRIAAHEIFRYLLESGLIDPGYQPHRFESHPPARWLRQTVRFRDFLHAPIEDDE